MEQVVECGFLSEDIVRARQAGVKQRVVVWKQVQWLRRKNVFWRTEVTLVD